MLPTSVEEAAGQSRGVCIYLVNKLVSLIQCISYALVITLYDAPECIRYTCEKPGLMKPVGGIWGGRDGRVGSMGR